MAEFTTETPPPYTLPTPLELQHAVQNTIASATTKPHYIFVETIMINNGLLIYVHRHPTNGRYITHPKFNRDSTSKTNHHIFSFAQILHIAAIQDFTTYQDLVNQILPCIVCPENKAADVRLSAFVGVAEMGVVWKGEGSEG